MSINLWLVAAHPEHLGRGEARKRVVAGHGDQATFLHARANLVALGGGALVVPENRRAQWLPLPVEQHQPMHLARQPDSPHLVARRLRRCQRRPNACSGGVPPVARLLLGPERARCRERQWCRSAGDDTTLLVNQQRLGAGGREVDTE
jgi:hypothetical protein